MVRWRITSEQMCIRDRIFSNSANTSLEKGERLFSHSSFIAVIGVFTSCIHCSMYSLYSLRSLCTSPIRSNIDFSGQCTVQMLTTLRSQIYPGFLRGLVNTAEDHLRQLRAGIGTDSSTCLLYTSSIFSHSCCSCSLWRSYMRARL